MKYLIVDLDDTLLQTSAYNTELYIKATLACTGINLAPLCNKDVRLTARVIRAVFSTTSTAESIIACKVEYIKTRSREAIAGLRLVRINDKVVEMINKFCYEGFKPILLTNAKVERVQLLYEQFALDRWFETYYANTLENKYDYIVKALNINPKICICLENEWTQVRLAQAAGFMVEKVIKI